jgi:hypothetical protein
MRVTGKMPAGEDNAELTVFRSDRRSAATLVDVRQRGRERIGDTHEPRVRYHSSQHQSRQNIESGATPMSCNAGSQPAPATQLRCLHHADRAAEGC